MTGKSISVTVDQAMSKAPFCIQRTDSIQKAHFLMLTKGLRHLPVLDGQRLVGVVSERDLYLVESLRGIDKGKEPVSAAMSAPVFATQPSTPLREVVHEMRRQRYGSTVVLDGERVVGIFTRNDALRVLDELVS